MCMIYNLISGTVVPSTVMSEDLSENTARYRNQCQALLHLLFV